MLVDAIILTGGRSSRLDSVPKSEFIFEDSTLLNRTLRAAANARRIVVVGPEPTVPLADAVLLVREKPPFGGPVAALAAGVTALSTHAQRTGDATSDAILVLACDMPHIGPAVPALLTALEKTPDADGVVAVDAGGRRQPLAAIYRTSALLGGLDAVGDAAQPENPLAGLSMFRLLDHLGVTELPVPAKATADVDTWDDAVRLGVTPPVASTRT